MRTTIAIAAVLALAITLLTVPTVQAKKGNGNSLGPAAGTVKITFCHLPPGNPANAHEITTGNPAVIRAHLGAEILSLCVAAGGTVTGEHGVGIEKIDSMCEQFTAEELAQFHALKAAFDPQGLLNPGKAVPTLHRCAELGAMHVHGGKLPFPDLPRF